MNWNVFCFHAALGKGSRLYIAPTMWDGEDQPPYRYSVGDKLALNINQTVMAGLVLAVNPDSMEVTFGDDIVFTLVPNPNGALDSPIQSKIPYDGWIVN